jgi:hypothetical protein
MTVEDLGFLHWWGVPTLYRCLHDPEPSGCDVALVGVPHSSGMLEGNYSTETTFGPNDHRQHRPGIEQRPVVLPPQVEVVDD